MSNTSQKHDAAMLEELSAASKQFYSAGTSFSTVGCAAIVAFVWGAMADLYAPFSSKLCGLVVSILIVLAYALVVPEPQGYPNGGKMRITLAECIFGFINSFVVYSTAIALKALV